MNKREQSNNAAERITLHTLDFDDHGDVYDYCMVNGKPGDFFELSNNDVVYLHEAWPVLIRSENPPSKQILHRFDQEHAHLQAELIQSYDKAKANNDFEAAQSNNDFPKP